MSAIVLPAPASIPWANFDNYSDAKRPSTYSWPSDHTLVAVDGASDVSFERRLGDSEASYYLPSRESGVNDMYLHLGFRAPASLFDPARVSIVWAIMRVRHPLIASEVHMHDYDDIRFIYNVPRSSEDALQLATEHFECRSQTKEELLDNYLNGPRTLSDRRLSYLILSSSDTASDEWRQFELLICAMHFIGDGMALHTMANEIFSLLGSDKTDSQLRLLLDDEWSARCRKANDQTALPTSLEARLPRSPAGRFRLAAEKVDFKRSQDKLIGGQTFPKRSGAERCTIVPTISVDEQKTKRMLKTCKAHGVSISAALFALCNVAWARVATTKKELPTMMYSALNTRPYLNKNLDNDSYWFLAVGYFNVILPSWIPASDEQARRTFWHRSRQAKDQSTRAAKSPMLISRTREMAEERGARARVWAKEDDDKAAGRATVRPTKPPSTGPAKPPSAALMGLSLLGNLDGMYKHDNYPSIQLHTLTTGSRQRSGGMLLFGYTFAKKLWISLGYDKNGFDKEVVDRFWDEVIKGVDEFLLE